MEASIEFDENNIEELHTTIYSMVAAMLANDKVSPVVRQFVTNIYRAVDSVYMLHVTADMYKSQHAFLENAIGKINLERVVNDMRKSIERNTDFDDGF